MTTTIRLRADDADRQAAVDELARHLADGRMDLGEYDQRVAKAYAVTYTDEFAVLFGDLPSRGRAGFDGGQGFPAAEDASSGSAGSPWGSSFPQFGAQFGEAMRTSQKAFRDSEVGRSVRNGLQGRSGRPHPVVIVLAVIGALIVIGTLVSALVPLLAIAGLIYLFSLHRGRSRSPRRESRDDHGAAYRGSPSGW